VYDGADFTLLRDRRYTPLLIDVTYKRRVFEILLDLCLVAIAYYAAYIIRFDRSFASYYRVFVTSLPIVIACQLLSFWVAGVYRGIWRYISVADLTVFAKGVVFGTLSSIIAVLYLYRFEDYSRGVFLIYAMLTALLTVGARLSFRTVAEYAGRHRNRGGRALIYGAGEAGMLLLRELRNNLEYDLQPVGFVDDDPGKSGKRIGGIPVVGTAVALERVIVEQHPDVLIISSRKIGAGERATVQRICYESGTKLLELDLRLKPIGPSSSVEAG
jgi:UDP-GlcNAc:undecaprenyl-phosphate GlcNAc-1-phosphate transferase